MPQNGIMEVMMKLYMSYVSIHIRSVLQYKMSFLLSVIGQFLVTFNVFLGMYFLYLRFNTIGDYSFSELLLCYSIVLMQYSVGECIGRGFDMFPSMLGNGEFDRVLVRPKNEIFQVLASKFELSRIGRLLQAIVMLAYGVVKSGIDWNIGRVITVIFMIIGGTVIFIGLFIVYAGFCFFTTEGLEFMNIFTDGAKEHGKYPFNIYGKKVLIFTTYIIPYALTQYYPLLYVYGRVNHVGYIFLPLIAILFIIPCYAFFRVGIRHYKSTGS